MPGTPNADTARAEQFANAAPSQYVPNGPVVAATKGLVQDFSQVERQPLDGVLNEMKDVFDATATTCDVKTRHFIPLTESQPVVERLRRTSVKQDAIIEERAA
jgi:hypothetical protein